MNKKELIEALKEGRGLSSIEALKAVEMFFDSISGALVRGDRVEIRGLCSFHVKNYKGYAGINPKSGKLVQVKPKKLPFFKCGAELKKRVNR